MMHENQPQTCGPRSLHEVDMPLRWAPSIVTRTTDGRTHIALFDGEHTAAIEHITLDPNGNAETRW